MGELLKGPMRSILWRVLAVVVGAGIVALALSTAAVVWTVGADKEAGLVDGTMRRAGELADAVDHRIDLARAELRAVALAARHGDLVEVPSLVSGGIVAVRCRRGNEELVDAASDLRARELLAEREPPAPDEVRLSGEGHLVLTEHLGDVEVTALVDLSSVLRVPHGWRASVRPAQEAQGADGQPGAVVAHRTRQEGDELARAEVTSRHGLRATIWAPLGPARDAAVRITRQVVLWSLGAAVPLALLAWLLGRAVTSPVRRLAQAVRKAGDRPVALPPLPNDEIGNLGLAIGNMSERLHDDRRALREAVHFARSVGRLRHRTEVLRALEEALREAFPTGRWHAVPLEALEEGRVPEGTPCDAATLRDMLGPMAGEHEADDSGTWPVAAPGCTAHGMLVVPLQTSQRAYGVLLGSGANDELALRHAELLSRVAVTALRNADLLSSAVANEKLAALGRLSASVAHEMNNPLAFVLTNAKVLEEELDGELKEAASDVREGADRLARIVRDLSSLSRGGFEVRKTDCQLGEVVRRAVRVARAKHPQVRMEWHEQSAGRLECDAGRLEQVLLNLIANAADAAAAGPSPRVIVRSRIEGTKAIVEVTDNGPGVPAHVRERLFEAFYTTKGRGGTGLGLFVARSLVQAHGGDLALASTGPTGTVFRVALPGASSERTHPVTTSAGPPAMDPSQALRVLVVDDEPAIVRSLQRWLGRHAEVTGTTDPREALSLASSGAYELVLCDVNMPGMTGLELASAIRRGRPELAERVVLMTGSGSAAPNGYEVLRKPLAPEKLERLLKNARDRGTAEQGGLAC
ncbi:MAG: ATP-binding protein [Myxococcota bacterium]